MIDYPHPHASFTASFDSVFAILTVHFRGRLAQDTWGDYVDYMMQHPWYRQANARVLDFRSVSELAFTEHPAPLQRLWQKAPEEVPVVIIASEDQQDELQRIATNTPAGLMQPFPIAFVTSPADADRVATQAAITQLGLPDPIPHAQQREHRWSRFS